MEGVADGRARGGTGRRRAGIDGPNSQRGDRHGVEMAHDDGRPTENVKEQRAEDWTGAPIRLSALSNDGGGGDDDEGGDRNENADGGDALSQTQPPARASLPTIRLGKIEDKGGAGDEEDKSAARRGVHRAPAAKQAEPSAGDGGMALDVNGSDNHRGDSADGWRGGAAQGASASASASPQPQLDEEEEEEEAPIGSESHGIAQRLRRRSASVEQPPQWQQYHGREDEEGSSPAAPDTEAATMARKKRKKKKMMMKYKAASNAPQPQQPPQQPQQQPRLSSPPSSSSSVMAKTGDGAVGGGGGDGGGDGGDAASRRAWPAASAPAAADDGGGGAAVAIDIVLCACGNNIDYGPMIQCVRCRGWAHKFCTGFSDAEWEALQLQHAHYLCWLCNPRAAKACSMAADAAQALAAVRTGAKWNTIMSRIVESARMEGMEVVGEPRSQPKRHRATAVSTAHSGGGGGGGGGGGTSRAPRIATTEGAIPFHRDPHKETQFFDALAWYWENEARRGKWVMPPFRGKALDLYALYCGVKARHGIDAVIANKQWPDIWRTMRNYYKESTDHSFRIRTLAQKYLAGFLQRYAEPEPWDDDGSGGGGGSNGGGNGGDGGDGGSSEGAENEGASSASDNGAGRGSSAEIAGNRGAAPAGGETRDHGSKRARTQTDADMAVDEAGTSAITATAAAAERDRGGNGREDRVAAASAAAEATNPNAATHDALARSRSTLPLPSPPPPPPQPPPSQQQQQPSLGTGPWREENRDTSEDLLAVELQQHRHDAVRLHDAHGNARHRRGNGDDDDDEGGGDGGDGSRRGRHQRAAKRRGERDH